MKQAVQIGFGVRLILLVHKLFEMSMKVFAAHIRRIRNHSVVLLCQQPSLLKQRLDDWAEACVRSPCFSTSSSRCSISGNFAASFGGTWISEPNVLAFSNKSSSDAMSACETWPFSAHRLPAEQSVFLFFDFLEQILAGDILLVDR